MTANVSFKVDVKTGSVEVDSPPEHFQEVMSSVKDVLEIWKELGPVLADAPDAETASSSNGMPDAEVQTGVRKNDPAQRVKNISTSRSRARQSGGSSSRTGRIGSFELVDFGLAEKQERNLREFYSGKKPKEQNHQVATALYQGEKELKKKAFSYNEIYTLLRLSGEKELPKALDVVINRMIKDNWVIRETEGIALKFVGRDFVEQSLPVPE